MGHLARPRLPLWSLAGVALAVSLASLSARAETFTLDLSSPTYFDRANSTGLWNTLNQVIQAGVVVNNDATKRMDFGDGSDGAFSNGPAQTGITISGATITFNTNVKSTYQFTSFTLNGGNSIAVTGSNPLRIKVLGLTTIAGAISVDGQAGTGNNGGQNPSPGGTAVAGGGNGGASGASGGAPAAVVGTAGTGGGTRTVGGGAGANAGAPGDSRGGGGGCHGASGAGAEDSEDGTFGTGGLGGNCGGNTRTALADNFENVLTAGAGGGGGGAYPVGPTVQGGGGGAGGGAIHFASLGTITLSSTVSARGGQGGNNNVLVGGSDCGGAGGGGAGGSLWFQTWTASGALGTSSIANGGGGIFNTLQGARGDSTDPTCTGAYYGGHGSNGIIRLDTNGNAAGTTPAASLVTRGVGIIAGQTYVVYSRAMDFSSAYYSFSNATVTTGCGADGTLTTEFEGSNDGVNFGNAVSSSNISQLNEFAYIRLKVTIATTGANPPCLTGVSFNYTKSDLANFTLRGGMIFCGSMAAERGGRGARNARPVDMMGDLLMIGFAMAGARWMARSTRLRRGRAV